MEEGFLGKNRSGKSEFKQFIVILILSGILLFEMFCYFQKITPYLHLDNIKLPNQKPKDELIIALFMDNIIADSSKFYDNYFTNGLGYINYEYKVKDIKKEGEPINIYITFEGTPIVGPHISVGDDGINYIISKYISWRIICQMIELLNLHF